MGDKKTVNDKDTLLLAQQARALDGVLGALQAGSPNGVLAVDDVRDLVERARDRLAWYALEHIAQEFDLSKYWDD
jgi:hypothetical protein